MNAERCLALHQLLLEPLPRMAKSSIAEWISSMVPSTGPRFARRGHAIAAAALADTPGSGAVLRPAEDPRQQDGSPGSSEDSLPPVAQRRHQGGRAFVLSSGAADFIISKIITIHLFRCPNLQCLPISLWSTDDLACCICRQTRW